MQMAKITGQGWQKVCLKLGGRWQKVCPKWEKTTDELGINRFELGFNRVEQGTTLESKRHSSRYHHPRHGSFWAASSEPPQWATSRKNNHSHFRRTWEGLNEY